MKHVAFWTVVLLLAGGLFVLSERGCSILPAGPATDGDVSDPVMNTSRLTAEAAQEVLDQWGTKLRVQETGTSRLTTAAGPDRLFGTADDIQYASTTPDPVE